MTTLHILLASGENLPNLIPAITSFKDDPKFKANTALVLTSKSMSQRANMLKRALEYSGVGHVEIYQETCPDCNLQEMRQWSDVCAKKITAKYNGHRCILNITGGTKLMTIAFLDAFKKHGIETIYCDTGNDCIEHIDAARPSLKLPVDVLKLETCLAAQGYQLKKKETGTTAGIEKRKELTRKLANAATRIGKLIREQNYAWYQYNANAGKNTHITIKTGGLEGEERSLVQEARMLGLLTPSYAFQSEDAARYLGGGWLEEWCWIIGKELEANEPGKRLKSNRWGISLEILPFDTSQISGRNSSTLNELDAVYVHRNRMLLIECKTGGQISDGNKENQNILNKLEVLGNQFGGRLSTRWLLTARKISPNSTVIKRARHYGIRIVEPHELAQLKEKVQEWMVR